MGSLDLEAYITGIRNRDRRMVAKAITLVESTRLQDQNLAQKLLVSLSSGAEEPNSFRIGISGPPGVGKSTFIEALGLYLLTLGKRLAVLAVDPSSKRSGGSILGDKTRMGRLMGNPEVYIRPSPNGDTLGGVTRKSRETILILEAAGYDTILVETVGVGQSETTVAGMVDFFALLHLPNAGDDLQGIKRGIMEVANAILINKADGAFLEPAKQAVRGLKAALSLLGSPDGNWETETLLVSALEERGIAECWQRMWQFKETMTENGYLYEKRKKQNLSWMRGLIREGLQDRFARHPGVLQQRDILTKSVDRGTITPVDAATILLDVFEKKG
jgi:LAO/AO transport system kinase